MPAGILNQIPIPASHDTIVLLDWMSDETEGGRNLVRITPDGQPVWKATPPQNGPMDCFVAVEWEGAVLTANTRNCHRVTVD
ncbi:hypothetical protein, partial [Aminobacter aminovorans]